LNDNGVSAAILTYRLPKGQHEIPLSDAKKAIQTLKSAQHKLRFTKLGIIGFSAGGHLAASSLTLLPKQDRPDFGILIYPVISFGPFGHKGSRFNLLGELFENQKWIDYYSLESRVDSQTPPVFLAHAKDDKVVVIENSQMFYDKVKLHQPTSEFLILEQGGHGLNGYKGPSWDAWQEKSLKWIFKL
jgi:acetyl esterase/lipase